MVSSEQQSVASNIESFFIFTAYLARTKKKNYLLEIIKIKKDEKIDTFYLFCFSLESNRKIKKKTLAQSHLTSPP